MTTAMDMEAASMEVIKDLPLATGEVEEAAPPPAAELRGRSTDSQALSLLHVVG